MKEIEKSVFEYAILREEELIPHGFSRVNDHYERKENLSVDGYVLTLFVYSGGEVDGVVLDEGLEFDGYRRNVLGEFSAKIKEEYLAILRKLRDECFLLKKPISYYLLPSNPAIYDVGKGFRQYGGYLDWPARKKTAVGDVVFIYSARPFAGIAFRCEVMAVDEVNEGYGSRATYSTLLRLIETYDKDQLPLDDIRAHGLKTVRFFHKVSPEFAAYVMSKSDSHEK